jgi:hypothetical protein
VPNSTSQSSSPPDVQAREAVAALIALHIAAESTLIDEITAILRKALGWAAMPRIRRTVQQVVARLAAETPPLVAAITAAETTSGSVTADRTVLASLGAMTDAQRDQTLTADVRLAIRQHRALPASGGAQPPAVPPGTDVVPAGEQPPAFDFSVPTGVRGEAAIRRDLVDQLDDVRKRITRLPNDIYKVLAPQSARVLTLDVGLTTEQAQAIAWRDFMANGITGFVDKRGRNWSLSAYVEMAVRTASARAFNDANLERQRAIGVQLHTVSDDGSPCPLCLPWQNAVLSDGPVEDATVHVDGTIDEATAAGLFHPNCRHTLLAVFPGITILPPRETWTKARADRYAAVQKQRRLELEVRKAKRRQENALDPERAQEAKQAVRRAQQRLRDHVNSRDDLARDSRREQPHLRNATTKLTAALT